MPGCARLSSGQRSGNVLHRQGVYSSSGAPLTLSGGKSIDANAPCPLSPFSQSCTSQLNSSSFTLNGGVRIAISDSSNRFFVPAGSRAEQYQVDIFLAMSPAHHREGLFSPDSPLGVLKVSVSSIARVTGGRARSSRDSGDATTVVSACSAVFLIRLSAAVYPVESWFECREIRRSPLALREDPFGTLHR